MKHFKAQAILTLLALVSLSAVACSVPNSEQGRALTRTNLDVKGPSQIILTDGVYPVALGGEATPKNESKTKVVELLNVPVEGSGDPTPEMIPVIPQPLVRFREVSHFDFTFEENKCTEIGFKNTDELKAYTRDHIGSRLAVVIGNRVISHHKIREAIDAEKVRITCCTVGGGDHLHKHLKQLKLASDASRRSD